MGQPGTTQTARIEVQVGQAPPDLNSLLGGLMGGPPGAAGLPGGIPNLNSFLQGLIPQQNPQQPPQPASREQPSRAAGQVPMPAIQLPHQLLFKIDHQINSLHGPAAGFPGPRMPALQVDRNVVVLLGSYLANLSLQLQRVTPLM